MNPSYDFLKFLPKELSEKILKLVDDPCTFAVITAVSKIWRRFVLENKLSKQFCLNMYPELSKIVDIEETINAPEPCAIRTEMVGVPGSLVKEHRVFSFLGAKLALYPEHRFLRDSIAAPDEEHSSEDDYDEFNFPEQVFYHFLSDMRIISEIHVMPYKEDFERKDFIYSAKSVRVSVGYKKSSPLDSRSVRLSVGDKKSSRTSGGRGLYTWTYVSPDFELAQESGVQKFHLPKQVLCFGGVIRGVIKTETVGTFKKNNLDGRYYASIGRMDPYGHSLGPEFGINMIDGTGKYILKCNWPRLYGDDGSDFDIPDPDNTDLIPRQAAVRRT